ncbi:MAG: ATP-binding protein [Spirochaetota bacterium]|nr:ATP-binding protein [Spirochaetota bacterium]
MKIDQFQELDIVLVCGLQGSGKTHFARNFFRSNDRKRINRGELRKYIYEMTHFGDKWQDDYFNETDEMLVKHVERKILEHFLHNNRKVLIDNTSVTIDSRKNYVILAKKMNKSIGVIFLGTPVDKCLERNRKKESKLSENIITNLYAKIKLPDHDEGFKEVLIVSDY